MTPDEIAKTLIDTAFHNQRWTPTWRDSFAESIAAALAAERAQRREARQLGAKVSRNPLPGGRNSKWKRKISGEVVPR